MIAMVFSYQKSSSFEGTTIQNTMSFRRLVASFLVATQSINAVKAFSLLHRQQHDPRLHHQRTSFFFQRCPTTTATVTSKSKVLFSRLSEHPHECSCNSPNQQSHISSSALFYRAHDPDDEETSLIKVKTRTPPGFDTKVAVAEQQQQQQPDSAMNKPLIHALLYNQGLILGFAVVVSAILLVAAQGPDVVDSLDELLRWTGEGPGIFNFWPTTDRLLAGLVGALPMLVFSNAVENSDKQAFANINFSTILMVMTLFGRRKTPPDEFIPEQFKGQSVSTSKPGDVLGQSFVLAGTTGVCEELVFRRLVPSLITAFTANVPVAFIGQAALFGLGHMQPKSSVVDNSIVAGLQGVNGLFLGGLYLATGDVLPCMIAHAIFDFVQFFKTWWDANAQIEYADQMYFEPLPDNTERQARALLVQARGPNAKANPRLFDFIKRLFYTFDFDKNKTLSRSEVRKGIAYMALEQATQPPAQSFVDELFTETVQSRPGAERLDLADFVSLYAKLAKASNPGDQGSREQQTMMEV
jgi:membrane protease YdiL (CAAX protease family)